MIKPFFQFCLAIFTAGSFFGQQAADGYLYAADPTPGSDAISGSYCAVVDSYDWGCSVSRVILTLEKPITKVSADQFLVVQEKQVVKNGTGSSTDQSPLTIAREKRTVTDAYLCDAQGNPIQRPSPYAVLELQAAPNVGSPLCYHPDTQHYSWAEPYRLVIELTSGASLTSGYTHYSRLAIDRTAARYSMPDIDPFAFSQYTGSKHTFSVASYSPAQDGHSHPLVIWLHGLGEGGSDPRTPLLGASVSTFAQPDFQSLMGGAHVLVPQCPTFWLDDGTGSATRSGNSTYTRDLMALIRSYVSAHPDVDPDRIYIGGCSNGGYMTLALLLEAPDYFAAAFPTCQAYQDKWLSDEDINTLKNIPLWFTHSQLDQICPPAESTFPTAERLLAAGAKDVRLVKLGEITNSSSFRFDPHYSWVPVLNGQCADPSTSENLFSWLCTQSRK